MIESELIECRAGDVHITPEQIGDVNVGTYGPDDYVLSTGQKLAAELISNNILRIFDGVMVYGGLRDAIPVNKYYDLTIDNGTQGKNRNDIIVRHYTKDDDSQKKARSVFKVIKGTPVDGTAVDPEITVTDLRGGALTHDMKLYRAKLEGLNVVAVEPLFDVLIPMSEQQAMLTELNKNCIIESGNNDRGDYRKWADGTLEQWGSSNNDSGNDSKTVNMPISFADKNYNIQIQNLYVSSSYPVTLNSVLKSSESVFVVAIRQAYSNDLIGPVYFDWRAIGRWK